MTTSVKVTCHNHPVEVVALDALPGQEPRESQLASLTAGMTYDAAATDTRSIIVREIKR